MTQRRPFLVERTRSGTFCCMCLEMRRLLDPRLVFAAEGGGGGQSGRSPGQGARRTHPVTLDIPLLPSATVSSVEAGDWPG